MQFHAVHRQSNGERIPGNRDTPRHIIARFICRKDRDFIWSQREAIKKTETYKDLFFFCARFGEGTGRRGRRVSRGSSLC